MHDWTFISIFVDWGGSLAILTFKNTQSKEVELRVNGLISLYIPRKNEWGESVSVNEVIGPYKNDSKSCLEIEIEIQSGDKIKIEADSINMPL